MCFSKLRSTADIPNGLFGVTALKTAVKAIRPDIACARTQRREDTVRTATDSALTRSRSHAS